MLDLLLLWLLIGGLLGMLGYVAALMPEHRNARGLLPFLRLAGIGALAGLCGGWAGALALGRLYGSFCAVWIAILAVVLTPYAASALRRRARANDAGHDDARQV